MLQNKFLLTIDIGNTNTSFILWDLNTNEIYKQKVFHNNIVYTNFFLNQIQNIFLPVNPDNKSEIFTIICSVNSEIEKKVTKILYNIKKQIISSLVIIKVKRNKIKLNINYKGTVGLDRIVSAFAINKIYKKDGIIINMGTATTIDILRNNSFSGGIILPGIKTMLESLNRKTNKIKLKKIKFPRKIEGKCTSECVSSGIFFGNLFILNNFIKVFKNKLIKPVIVISGGNSKFFLNKTTIKTVYIPHLIHIGLLEIFKSLYPKHN